ncbi:MAG: hypothetical protein IJU57_02910 [Clostridia bacterium]|nr:hypothetical protein [Clostridia bacterium]
MRKKPHGFERLLALSDLLYPFEEIIAEDRTAKNSVRLEDPGTVFASEHPLKLEVGCGKGDFICTLSEKEPCFNYIALEKVPDVAVVAVEKYASRRGLGRLGSNGGWVASDGTLYPMGTKYPIELSKRGNTRFAVAEASEFLSGMPDESLAGIIANFSDPWTRKSSYSKRRLTSPEFVLDYRRVLLPGALFSFKTDDEKLFDYTLETLEGSGFSIEYSTRDLHSEKDSGDNIITEYERNFMNKGMTIKKLIARPVK